MTQRKLTDDEMDNVMVARCALRKIRQSFDSPDWLRDTAIHLGQLALHGTTDGHPCVDPEPPIPHGYRLAVAGDEGRSDCLFLHCSEWTSREPGGKFMGGYTFIVPADRTPTDEDAKSRPMVMVRDGDGQKWHKDILILVRGCEHSKFKFATTDTERAEIVCWKQCRHLYPDE